MIIRHEERDDLNAIRKVNEAAFETSAEADLIDALRTQVSPLVSLVAETEHEIIGHIMFSPVSLPNHPDKKIMGLAPMAVRPSWQRQGVGSELVRAGLAACLGLDFGAVVVLGHPDYYPRFGFVRADEFGLACEYDVPAEVFMALELKQGYLDHVSGTIQYHPAFATV
ncbi:MAG: N-acetyltransferase [Thiohalophilus sp.]|jgi:putative acetyltransferase